MKMKKTMLSLEKYKLDNIKVQIFLFAIPVIYHFFYSYVFEFQSYFDYMNLTYVYNFLSYMYYVIGIGCLIATIVLTVKTPKGIIKFIDYLIRAIMIASYAIRFFIVYTLYEIFEKFSDIQGFLVALADFITGIPIPDVFIYVTGIISFLRIIVTFIKLKKQKQLEINQTNY